MGRRKVESQGKRRNEREAIDKAGWGEESKQKGEAVNEGEEEEEEGKRKEEEEEEGRA